MSLTTTIKWSKHKQTTIEYSVESGAKINQRESGAAPFPATKINQFQIDECRRIIADIDKKLRV